MTDAILGSCGRVLSFLFRRQRGLCIYCEQVTVLPDRRADRALVERGLLPPRGTTRRAVVARYRRASREHVLRRADGGSDDLTNLVMACQFCNSARGGTDPLAHKAAMMALVEAGEHPLCPTTFGRTKRDQRKAFERVMRGSVVLT